MSENGGIRIRADGAKITDFRFYTLSIGCKVLLFEKSVRST